MIQIEVGDCGSAEADAAMRTIITPWTAIWTAITDPDVTVRKITEAQGSSASSESAV